MPLIRCVKYIITLPKGEVRGRVFCSLRQRTDCHVVSVWVPERELACLSVRVHVGLLLESGDQTACPLQGFVEIVHAEEQEEPVARRRRVRAHQGGVLVRAPLVKADQHRSIRIHDLTPVVMARSRLSLAEQRLIPFEATGYVADAYDRPRAFHRSSAVDLTPAH